MYEPFSFHSSQYNRPRTRSHRGYLPQPHHASSSFSLQRRSIPYSLSGNARKEDPQDYQRFLNRISPSADGMVYMLDILVCVEAVAIAIAVGRWRVATDSTSHSAHSIHLAVKDTADSSTL
jgi:hypothetical protein